MKKSHSTNGFFYIQTFSSTPYRLTDMKWISSIAGRIRIIFAGLWLVVRIILEYFGLISDGNDRTTGIKDLREEYRKANYR
jgi:hypothetical protein